MLLPQVGIAVWLKLYLVIWMAYAASATANTLYVQGEGASLPNDVYQMAVFASTFERPGVDVTYAAEGSSAGKRAVQANTREFAGSDSLLSDSDYDNYPDLQMFPTVAAAVVPVYNVPLLPRSSASSNATAVSSIAPGVTVGDRLVMSRGLLAQLFSGEVLHWNDTRLAAENPHLEGRLPPLPVIRAVRARGSGTTAIFASVLRSASSSFEASALPDGDGSLSMPAWPATNLSAPSMAQGARSRLSPAPGNRGVASRVVAEQGAIGYVVANEATKRGLSVALVRNRAGLVVDADLSGVLFALMELGGRFDERLNAELADAASSFAWPAVGYTYIIFRKTTVRQLAIPLAEARGTPLPDDAARAAVLAATDPQADAVQLLGQDRVAELCRERLETVRFWQWFYTSPVVEAGVARLGFATLPQVVRDEVLGRLLSEVECAGSPVIAQETSQPVAAIGTATLAPVMELFRSAYGVVDPDVDLEYNGVTGAVAGTASSRRLADRLEGPPVWQGSSSSVKTLQASFTESGTHASASQHSAMPRKLQFSDTSQGTSAEEAIGAALTFGDASAPFLQSGSARFALVIRPPSTTWASLAGARQATAQARGLFPDDPTTFPPANASLVPDGSPAALPGYAALTHASGDQTVTDVSVPGLRFQTLVLPMGVVGVSPVYSVSSLGSSQLRLSLPTLARIYMGDITSWNDPAIQQDNPDAAGDLPPGSIQVLVMAARSESTRILTATLSSGSLAFLAWMRSRLVALAPSNDMAAQAEAAAATETDLDLWPLSTSASATYVRVGGEGQMEARILDGNNVLGYMRVVGDIRADTATLLVGAAGAQTPVEIGTDSLSACVGIAQRINTSANGTSTLSTILQADLASFDPESWRFNASSVTRSDQCWPMHGVVYSMVPRLYFSSEEAFQAASTSVEALGNSLTASGNLEAGAAAGLASLEGLPVIPCSDGRTTAAVLEWMLDPDITSVPLQSFGIGTMPPAVLRAGIQALRLEMLCDSEPIVPRQIECAVGEGRVTDTLCIPCSEGTYSLDTSGKCLECPRGAVCKGGSHIGAARDFWQNPDDLTDLYRCDPDVCCIDSPDGFCDLDTPERCGVRREADSPLCGECSSGYSPFGSSCVRCTRPNPAFISLALTLGFLLVVFLLVAGSGADAGGFTLFKVYVDFVQILVVIMGASRMATIRIDVAALDLSSVLGDEEFPCLVPLSPFSSAFFSLGWTGMLICQFAVLLLVEGLYRKSSLVAIAMGGWIPCCCACIANPDSADSSAPSTEANYISSVANMTDDAILSTSYDSRSKKAIKSPEEIRAMYAANGVRGCGFCCFLCCGDSCLPETIEVEKSEREKRELAAAREACAIQLGERIAKHDLESLPASSGPGANAAVAAAPSLPQGRDEETGELGEDPQAIEREDSIDLEAEGVAVLPMPAAQLGSSWLMKYVNALWRLVLIAYTSVVTTALQFFSCRDVAGTSLMRTQLTIECGTPQHAGAAIVMAVVVAVAVVGLPIALVSIMFNELGAGRNLRHGKFRGVSLWVAIVFQWFRLRLASIPVCGPCCCHKFRQSDSYQRYEKGQAIDGWYVIHPEEKAEAKKDILARGGDPALEGFSDSTIRTMNSGYSESEGMPEPVLSLSLNRGRRSKQAAYLTSGSVSGKEGRENGSSGKQNQPPDMLPSADASVDGARSDPDRPPVMEAWSDATPSTPAKRGTEPGGGERDVPHGMLSPGGDEASGSVRLRGRRRESRIRDHPKKRRKSRRNSKRRRRWSMIRMDTIRDLGVEFGAWVHTEHRLWYEAWFFVRKNFYAFLGVFLTEPPLARAAALFLVALVLMGSQLTMQALSDWEVRLSYNVMAACIVGVAGFEMMARAQEEEISRDSTVADLWVRTMISVIAIAPAIFLVVFYGEALVLWLQGRGVCLCCPTFKGGVRPDRMARVSSRFSLDVQSEGSSLGGGSLAGGSLAVATRNARGSADEGVHGSRVVNSVHASSTSGKSFVAAPHGGATVTQRRVVAELSEG